MSDLISREAAINALKEYYCEDCTHYDVKCKSPLSENCPIYNVISTISIVPAVDAEPVRHGEWIKGDYVCGDNEWKCSVCGETEWRGSADWMKFCMYCGAKMDLEDDQP